MSEKTVFSYFNSIKQKTLQKLVNDIIDSTHNNNSQKLLYLLSQAIQINLSSFSLSQIELIAIAIVKLIEANYDKRDIQQFLKFLCKMLKHLKNNNTFKISLDWKLFYKIFFIFHITITTSPLITLSSKSDHSLKKPFPFLTMTSSSLNFPSFSFTTSISPS